MTHVIDEMLQQAADAIAAMRQAARHARALHARAELMRHMRGTAARLATRPLPEAAALVAGEWMKAWQLDETAYQAVSQDVRRFTEAFCADARDTTPATQHAILEATETLETALTTIGTTIADQMAWRSECAHGWWELVAPTPAGLPARPGIPPAPGGKPFWESGCPERCL